MENKKQAWKIVAFLTVIFFLSDTAYAQKWSDKYIHRIGIEGRAGYIFPTNPFLEGDNYYMKKMKGTYAGHLKYSFQLRPHTAADQAYISAYQGIGLGYFDFGNRLEVGTPIALYLFQGGVSLNFPHACHSTTNGTLESHSDGRVMTPLRMSTIRS